jgi:hypothetical protein
MKRTTIYLDAELELMLKREARRANRPMADLIRDAIRSALAGRESTRPPGAGAFASKHRNTASRVDQILARSGFGEND